jgi:hypothetical protein
MMSVHRVAILLVTLAWGPLGCGGDDDEKPAIQSLCEKTEACGILPDEISVETCVEQTNVCLDALTSAKLSDWDNASNTCLKMEDCEDFRSCYLAMNPTRC